MLLIAYCNHHPNKTFSCCHNIHHHTYDTILAVGLLSGQQAQIIQNYCVIPNQIFIAHDDGNKDLNSKSNALIKYAN